jgi:hypothetical protein
VGNAKKLVYVGFGTIRENALFTVSELLAFVKLWEKASSQFKKETRVLLRVVVDEENDETLQKLLGEQQHWLRFEPKPVQQTLLFELYNDIAIFVSHCGVGSLVDGFKNSIPIIGWPQQGDQPGNARFTESLGAIHNLGNQQKGEELKGEHGSWDSVVDYVFEHKREFLDKATEALEVVHKNAANAQEIANLLITLGRTGPEGVANLVTVENTIRGKL